MRSHELNQRFPALMDTLLRHAVAIEWVDSDLNGGNKRHLSCSSFVVQARGMWFLVTAGHILNDRDLRLGNGRRLLGTRLNDAASGGRFEGIPIDFDGCPSMRHDIDGADFGIVALRPFYVKALATSGVVALPERTWADPPVDAFARVMLGLPSVLKGSPSVTTQAGKVTVRAETAWAMISLQPATDIPEAISHDADNRIYGVVLPGEFCDSEVAVPADDIDGMSGGPIFDIQNGPDGKARYWLVAVQAKWAPISRVISGTRLAPILAAFASGLDDGIRSHFHVKEAESAD